jgi:hypothetical protein
MFLLTKTVIHNGGGRMRIQRSGKRDVEFEMNICDAKNFLCCLNKTRLQGKSKLNVMKNIDNIDRNCTLCVESCMESNEIFFTKGGDLRLLLCMESIEYAEYLISSFLSNGFFPVAEFMEIQTDKFRNPVRLYFVSRTTVQ